MPSRDASPLLMRLAFKQGLASSRLDWPQPGSHHVDGLSACSALAWMLSVCL